MADSSVPITAGTGTPVRVLTALGAGVAGQQVVTLADSAGNLLGTAAAPVPVQVKASATGTITSVTSIATTTVLLASNTARLSATFFNDAASTLYLALAATASATAYTVQLPGMSYYELPANTNYTGVVSGIWATATSGACRATELT